MNAKKELLLTSLLAIALAAGLGALSFGLFSSSPPNVQIDVSAEKNGATSLSFLPLDQVLLEAQVSSNNASITGNPVTFEVESPNGTNFLSQTAYTDNQGTANVTFQIPWPLIESPQTTWELGTWQTQATTRVHGQIINATTSFNCETLMPRIDVFTDKGGRGQNTGGGTFTTNETVHIYVEAWNELNQTVPDWQVSLEALILGGGHYVSYVSTTNASGIATIINPINPSAAETYEDVATASIGGTVVSDVVRINIQLSG